jgi:hypothetical protein
VLNSLSAISFADAQHGLAVGMGGVIVRTSDGGASWTIPSSSIERNLLAVALRGDTCIAVGDDGAIVRSSDGGATWQNRALNTPAALRCVAITNAGAALVGGDDGLVFLSRDAGDSWKVQSSGTMLDLYSISMVDENLGTIVGAGGAILHTTTGGVESVKPLKTYRLPEAFSLSQNYPNPFNPTTNFQFSIASLQLTILKVYDVLGREVATLVNEVKPPGEYTVWWDATGVPSGVYFYRLTAGAFSETRKLILLR